MTASYFDGRSALRQSVELRLTGEGLHITRADRGIEHWPFHTYRTQRSPGDKFIRFERAPYRGECLLIENPDDVARLLRELRQSAPGRLPRTAAALLAGILLLSAAIYAGFPYLVLAIARLAPVSFEERLGSAVFQSLAPPSGRVSNATAQRTLDRISQRLTQAAPGPYSYRIALTRNSTINAWAAPGGYVNVYCGLVDRLESGDELAAILAHEFQHVTQRHSTRSLVRNILIRGALSLTGTGGDGLFDAAGMMGALHLMRTDEASADAGALILLRQAAIDPRAMAEAFSRIDRESTNLPSALDYLSTHPSTASRIEAAKRAAAANPGPYQPVLSAAEWKQFQSACYSFPDKGKGK